MLKLAAIEFAHIFSNYCDEVREGNYEKIPYSTWRTLDRLFKELQADSYKPKDWYTMPIYINLFNVSNSSADEVETRMDLATADKSYELTDLVIPEDFAFFISDQTYEDDMDVDDVLNDAETQIKIEKENKTMNASMTNSISGAKTNSMNDMLPTFDFGPVTSDAVRVSPYGMAVKNRDGGWVSYNAADGSVINVSGFTFDLGQMLFKVPVALNQIQKGDMVIHNRVPMYVTDVAAGGKQVSVVDIREGEIKTVMPPTNMFGFNFVTKVVSLINFQTNTPDPNNPFGNIMPFIFMSSMFNGESGDGLGDMFKGDFGKLMMYSMVFGGGQNPFGSIFNGLMPQVSQTPAQTLARPAVPAAGNFSTQVPPQIN